MGAGFTRAFGGTFAGFRVGTGLGRLALIRFEIAAPSFVGGLKLKRFAFFNELNSEKGSLSALNSFAAAFERAAASL